MSIVNLHGQPPGYEVSGFRSECRDPRVDACRAAVAAAVRPRTRAFVADLVTLSVHEIAPLEGHDQVLLRLLEASIEENVVTVLNVLEHGVDPVTLDAPAAANVYARRLAQRDIPLSALLRAYRLGQEAFLGVVLEEAVNRTGDEDVTGATMISLVRLVAAYIDRVCEHVARTYEEERERWVSRRGALQSRRVQDLLAGGPVDVRETEVALGYRLQRTHVAAEAWVDPTVDVGDQLVFLERVARSLSSAVEAVGQPLVVPSDERDAWFWIPVARGAVLDDERLAEVLAGLDVPVRVSVGAPGDGVEGFRRSHRQSRQVKTVMLLAEDRPRSVVTFPAVGALALMCTDLDGLRAWVHEVLGPLADGDERSDWLRGTLRVFLEHNGSYAAAAEELNLHRNTVQYRVQQAENVRGPWRERDRQDLQLALTACRWLGDAVLRPIDA